MHLQYKMNLSLGDVDSQSVTFPEFLFIRHAVTFLIAHFGVCDFIDLWCESHQNSHWSFIITKWGHDIQQLPALMVLCEGIHWSPGDSPHKWPLSGSFDVFFVISLSQLLNKQQSWLFKLPWCPSGITVMDFGLLASNVIHSQLEPL